MAEPSQAFRSTPVRRRPMTTLRTDATQDELTAFLTSWPPGIGRLETEDGDLYGLLIRRGDDVVWCHAAVFTDTADVMDLAERASHAVVEALVHADDAPLAATAFVVGEGDSLRAGVAVIAFADDAPEHPGAARAPVAQALVSRVSATVAANPSALRAVPIDEIGTYRLQAMVTTTGLVWVARTPPDSLLKDVLPDDLLHLPCVAFAEED